MDCTVKDAMEKNLVLAGLKRNCSRGNQLLVLHIIGPDGFVKDKKKVGSAKKARYDWFKEVLKVLPDHSVVVMDNTFIHNKRAKGTPKLGFYKAICNNG